MAAPATADAIRDVNTRYHDAAAAEYDYKWGIDFHEIGRRQVLGKLRKALGSSPGPFPEALEIGAGTGYFSLNLIGAGVIGHATATDISPGMLAATQANAKRLGFERRLDTVVTDAEQLPFADESFDLVFGHASSSATPSCTTCRTSIARSRSSCAYSSPAGRCSSPVSRRVRATASPPTRSARP
jgi:SAM-dependent methyltransferase